MLLSKEEKKERHSQMSLSIILSFACQLLTNTQLSEKTTFFKDSELSEQILNMTIDLRKESKFNSGHIQLHYFSSSKCSVEHSHMKFNPKK